MKVNNYKCPICSRKFKTMTGWGDHMDSCHPEDRPEGYSTSRYFYYVMTGKTHGKCRTCKGDTSWNESSQKYNQYCDNPACKKEYVKIAHQRMIDSHGKVHLLDDPMVQRKMMTGRKLSGSFVMQDGGKIDYFGSYEKNFLEMLDSMFGWPSNDIFGPSPHTYYYDYENEKDPITKKGKKFYIPDFFIPSINAEIEIEVTKSGNEKFNETYLVKKEQKAEVMRHNTHVNYIKISDNDFTPFFEFLMKAKEIFPKKNTMQELVMESEMSMDEVLEIATECSNTDSDSRVVDQIVSWCIENEYGTQISKSGDWGLDKWFSGNDSLFITSDPNCKKIISGLKGVIDNSKYRLVIDNYNTIFLKRKKIVASESLIGKALNTVCHKTYLDKDQILTELDKLMWPKDEYYVGYKSGLVLQGVFDKTHYIDIMVTEKLGWKLIREGYSYTESLGETRIYITDRIDVFVRNQPTSTELIDSHRVNTVENILEDYKKLYAAKKRSKDRDTIKQIETFLRGRNVSALESVRQYATGIPGDIRKLNDELNENYTYGVVHNGKVITGDTLEKSFDFGKDYRSLSLKDFSYYHTGVCWDYVHYEATWFESHGYKHEEYYIECKDKNYDLPTHTFLLFTLPDSTKTYYFESSWYDYRGIEEFSSKQDALDTILGRHMKLVGVASKRNTICVRFDATSRRLEHLRCDEYMIIASRRKTFLLSIPASVTEACNNVSMARKFVAEVRRIAKKYDANYFIVTDGASGTSNDGNPAVNHARRVHEEWEREHGFDPDEDGSKGNESYVFSQDDIVKDLDKFESGESNILLVTGLSRAGKTTLSKDLAKKYDAEVIEIDMIDDPNFIVEKPSDIRIHGKIYDEWLNNTSDGKAWATLLFYDTEKSNINTEPSIIERSRFIGKFIKWAIDYCNKHKERKYIIEGLQLFEDLSPEDISGIPIIIKGTSMLKSYLRRYKRKGLFKTYLLWEKNLKELRDKTVAMEEAHYSKENCCPVYIVLMHSGTLLSNIIQKFTNDEFSHACISFNSNLTPMYSFGNKKVGGIDAGFTMQSPSSEFFTTKKAYYKVYVMYVSKDAYDKMRENLEGFIQKRNTLKYDLFNLLSVWRGKPSEDSKKFFCSRFVMQVIGGGRNLEKVPSLWKPQDISELEDITCVNKGDDFSKYNYHITEENLRKVQKKQFSSIAFESWVAECLDEESIAMEGLFSFKQSDPIDIDITSWRDKIIPKKGLIRNEGHSKPMLFGPFVSMENGYIILRGINYQVLRTRIKHFYQDKSVQNIFLPIYNAVSFRKFEKKRIQRSDIKIEYLESPEFFALELTKLFSELGEFYHDKRYLTIANLIYKRSWLREADKASTKTNPLDSSNLEKKLQLTLLPYQKSFIENYPILKAQLNLKGYILAFEQGLGKTITGVALAECLDVDHVYIVCPNTSSMKQIWANAIRDYVTKYKDMDVYLGEVIICDDKDAAIRYDKKRTKYFIINNESIKKMMPFVLPGRNMLIVDESHNFRNIKGKRTQELIALQTAIKATDTLLMSGTPIKATPNELAPSLRLIDPTFTDRVGEIYSKAFSVHHEIALSLVKSRFGRVMLRQTKAVLGNSLPPKENKDLPLTMPGASKYLFNTVIGLVMDRYDKIFEDGLKDALELENEFYEYIDQFAAKRYNNSRLRRLVKMSACIKWTPDLHEIDIDWLNDAIRDTMSNIKDNTKKKRFDYLVKNYLRYKNHCVGIAFGEIMPQYRNSLFIDLYESNKELIIQMIRKNPTKTIIFSQFRQVVDHIYDSLSAEGIGSVLIHGGIKDRLDVINIFKETDAIQVMVATPKTLGVGITLTEASQVFFFGPPWRQADYDQCADRVHRIGQTQPVTIYNVILDTGEELNLSGRMNNILSWSKRMVGEVVDTSLNSSEEDSFVDEVLVATESANKQVLRNVKDFFDVPEDNSCTDTSRVIPENMKSVLFQIETGFRMMKLVAVESIPAGYVIDTNAIHWPNGCDQIFKNLKFSDFGMAVFSTIADSLGKENVRFVEIVENGTPHWILVTIKTIRKGSVVKYHPNSSDMTFSSDLE